MSTSRSLIRHPIESILSKSHQWAPWLIVIGALLASIALPLVFSPARVLLLTVAIIGAGAAIVFLRWPALGLIALLLIALMAPSPALPGGLNVAVGMLILLLGLWLFDMVVLRQELRFVTSRTIRPLLALAVVAILSFVIGQLPWFASAPHAPMSAQIGGLLIFVLSVGAFLLAANQLHDLRWLRWLTWLFIVIGWLHVAGWIIPGVSVVTSQLIQFGVIDNGIYWTWLVALAASQAYFNRDLPIFWRVVFGLIAASTLYVGFVLNRDWKSGYLPPIAAVAAMVAARSWRLALLVGLVGIFPALYLVSDAVGSDEYSYSTRVDALIIMMEMVRVSPLLGFGPANYYWYTPLYKIRGWEVTFNSHNQYADILAQVGILGMACFVWFVGELGWLALKLRTQVEDGFNRAYVYGVIGGLAGTLVAGVLVDWVFPFVYNIGLRGFRGSMLGWIFLGGLVSIEYVTRQRSTSVTTRSAA
jgi:hypothetical protein